MRIRKTAFRAALAALLGAAFFMACESDSGGSGESGTPESGTPESGTPESAEINDVTSEPSSSAITLNFTAGISGSKGDTVSVSFSVSGASNYKQVAAASETFGLDWISDSQIWSENGVSDGSTSKFTVTATADFTDIAFKIYVQHPLDSSKSSVVTISDIRVTVTSASGGSGSGSGKYTTVTSQKTIPSGKALEFVSGMKIGWNLGNALDAHNNGTASETAWGNPTITSKIFEGVKSAGFDTVRVPVTWLGHIGSAPDYTIDTDYLSRVAEVVGYAKDAGLKVIINIHHDGADSIYWLNIKSACGYVSETESNPTDASATAANTAIKAQLAAMWKQIATKFPDSADYLIFETMNEIHDGGWGWGENKNSATKQYDILNEWNQTCVTAIRGAGAENYISVPGYCANPDLTMTHLTMPADTLSPARLIVTVHDYDPNDFVLDATVHEWGMSGTDVSTWGQESGIEQTFAALYNKYIANGIPVLVSECGPVYQSGYEKFRRYYGEFFVKLANVYGLVPIIWDNGATGSGKEKSGLFDRSTGAVNDYCEDYVEAIVAAADTSVTQIELP